jgi:hypothetical protein
MLSIGSQKVPHCKNKPKLQLEIVLLSIILLQDKQPIDIPQLMLSLMKLPKMVGIAGMTTRKIIMIPCNVKREL